MQRGDDLTVLLVDEDVDMSEYWTAQLSRAFPRVHATASARAALERVHREVPDVVLANAQLHHTSGFDLCAELRAHRNLQHVVVIVYKSGYINASDRQLADQVQADLLLPRGTSIAELITSIREAHAERCADHMLAAEGLTLIEDMGGDDTQEDLVRRKLLERMRQLHEERDTFRRALSRYRDFARASADFFWETDDTERLRFVASAPGNPLGLPQELHQVQTLSEFLCDHVCDEELETLRQALGRHQALEVTLRLRRDAERVVRLVAQPFHAREGRFMGYRGSLADITEFQLRSEQLQFDAHHDALTGLYNRRAFEGLLETALDEQREGECHVLCMMDLDFFKNVNDTAGHRAGDELLVQLGQLFRRKVRTNDMLARVGGDEFAVLLKNCALDQARRLIQELHHSVQTFQFVWEGRSFEIGVSFGLVEIQQSSLGMSEVMEFADQACYAAKRAGKNQIQIFGSTSASGELTGDALWLERFHQAVQTDQGLLLFRQPIRRSKGANGANGACAYEILVRLHDGERLVSPKSFLPVLERYRLATVLDRWVLDKTIDWLAERRKWETLSEDFYSINLSSHSLGDEAFRRYAANRIRMEPAIAECLCFEVTESTAIENIGTALGFINEMRELGVRFALDDFGTGFSSLAYLKTLPVDFLKLDGMFVMGINADPVDFGLLRTIQELAQVLKIKTIAEYVESAEIAARLREIGVDFMQGHFIGHPEIVDRVTEPRAAVGYRA